MNLRKQIQIGLAVLLVLIFTMVLKVSVEGTRSLAINQLSRSNQNMADLLALSLSPRLDDQKWLETSMDAIFDSGRYSKIALLKQDGRVIYQRQAEISTPAAPSFLQKFIPLDLPVAHAQVFYQGINVGTIEVQLHPGSYYNDIWCILKRLCLFFSLFGVVVIVANHLILGFPLKTLQQIKFQAEAISKNEFIINEHISNTPELDQIRRTMNMMVEKLKDTFNHQVADIQYFQELQHQDTITGMNNRNFLIKQLNRFLNSDAEQAQGCLLIIGIVGMEQNNISTGHPAIQELYRDIAAELQQIIDTVDNAVTARISRQEFGIILPDCVSENAMLLARKAMTGILKLINTKDELADHLKVSGGLTAYSYKDDSGAVLSKADYALSTAKNDPTSTVELFKEQDHQTIMGKYQWQTMLHSALAHKRFLLMVQPVLSTAGELHGEIFINLTDLNGTRFKAGYFMPMAISLGMASRIDKYVLESASEYLYQNPHRILAVNITTAFCKDRLAVVWLRQFLEKNQSIQGRLYFEVNGHSLAHDNDIDIFSDISRMASQAGFGFGIDQCALDDTIIKRLKSIKPSYIKIEKDDLLDMEKRDNGDIALNALLTITENLDIKLIVTKIEDKAFQERLVAKKVKYFQGYAIADISPLRST